MTIKRGASQPVVDHTGISYPSIGAMCRHYGISSVTYRARRLHNWTMENALTKPVKEPVSDHLGNKYDSVNTMCHSYHIDRKAFAKRIDEGWPLKDALTVRQKKHGAVDHLGNHFRSVKEMCGHYGIKTRAYHYRLKQGWTVERALTIPAKNMEYEGFSVDAFAFQDHEGTAYYECKCKNCGYADILTYDEMAEHHLKHK